VGRWGWFGPTCQRGGSAGRTGKGQNHAVERCPYAFFRGRDFSPLQRTGPNLVPCRRGLNEPHYSLICRGDYIPVTRHARAQLSQLDYRGAAQRMRLVRGVRS
jgi:hypothetical protein